ncbi:MAG: hypothetical protein OCD01_16855 [Fibrobacterales bacterium]
MMNWFGKNKFNVTVIIMAILFLFSSILSLIVIGKSNEVFDSNFLYTLPYMGSVGDYFGGVLNPLFSFITIIMLIYTVRMQSEELKNSTEALNNSKTELSDQKQEMKLQNDTLIQQKFDTQFFQVLNSFSSIINSISQHSPNSGNNISGSECLAFWINNMSTTYGNRLQSEKNDNKRCKRTFASLWESRSKQLKHYLNYLTFLFDYVSNSSIESKGFYYTVILTNLSIPELVIILHVIADKYHDKLLPIAMEHNFLSLVSGDDFGNAQLYGYVTRKFSEF